MTWTRSLLPKLAVLAVSTGLSVIGVVVAYRLTTGGPSTVVVDRRHVFRNAQTPYYWDGDLHLNPAGHDVVADALLPRVLELVP